ncbi:hypothetical protein NKG05_02400 [Oerskovia sp. M15]
MTTAPKTCPPRPPAAVGQRARPRRGPRRLRQRGPVIDAAPVESAPVKRRRATSKPVAVDEPHPPSRRPLRRLPRRSVRVASTRSRPPPLPRRSRRRPSTPAREVARGDRWRLRHAAPRDDRPALPGAGPAAARVARVASCAHHDSSGRRHAQLRVARLAPRRSPSPRRGPGSPGHRRTAAGAGRRAPAEQRTEAPAEQRAEAPARTRGGRGRSARRGAGAPAAAGSGTVPSVQPAEPVRREAPAAEAAPVAEILLAGADLAAVEEIELIEAELVAEGVEIPGDALELDEVELFEEDVETADLVTAADSVDDEGAPRRRRRRGGRGRRSRAATPAPRVTSTTTTTPPTSGGARVRRLDRDRRR